MILVGSRALILREKKLLSRKPKDFDFICTRDEFDNWMTTQSSKVNPTKVYPETWGKDGQKMIVEGSTNCEFEIIQPGTSNEMLADLVMNDKESVETPFGWVPTLDMLFTIKSSHKYLRNSPHFWKTVADYHIMKHVGATVRPEYQEFFKLREKETYWYKLPKLNVTKQEFFQDDGISYVWDHDDIHKSVALQDRPAYTYYLKEGAQVQCDKEKFFALPESIRLAGVVEEAAVLAIERSLVPHPGVWTPEYAWKFALAKVCSSITGGWFRAFGYENILTVLKMYPKGYWEKFQSDCQRGLVKPHSGKMYPDVSI